MRKVLILAYFFPPCNLAAAQRAQGWAKYLKKSGIKPVVITRNWGHEISSSRDVSKAAGDSILYEDKGDYEVYYMPFQPNLRDRLHEKGGSFLMTFFRRFLSFSEILLQCVYLPVVSYRNIYEQARNVLQNDASIKAVIASGNPFILFRFAYLLEKEFRIPWIADYRDAWTTSSINQINRGILFRLINWYEKYFERRWVSKASLVTANSGPIAEDIHVLTKVRAEPVYNGFIAEDFAAYGAVEKYSKFTISYIGTLYWGQNIELFCSAFRSFVKENEAQKDIQLLFPGLAFNVEQAQRVSSLLNGLEEYFLVSGRAPRAEVLQTEIRSHLLLHVGWDKHKGIIASKIYEYIGSGSPILVVPSDNGSIAEIIKESGCGEALSTEDEVMVALRKHYLLFKEVRVLRNDVNNSSAMIFSREQQSAKLAALIKEIID